MSLIEQLGGYKNVIKHFKHHNYIPDMKIFIGEWFGFYSMQELRQALIEYRRKHNIYEMDDYIIHDGELMVFAMWSEAAKDCAYVGYAYAEDGFLLHKDEFRHATDAEIQAGRRLDLEVLHDHDIPPNTIVVNK